MNNNRTYKYLAAALMLSVGTAAFPTYALSLDQAWQAAVINAPAYEKAKIGVRISQAEKDASQAAWLPSLSASASTNWDEDANNSNSYNVQLSQTIWNSANWADLDKSQANIVAAKLEQQQARNELAADVLNAYLDQANAQDDLALAKNKFHDGEQLLSITFKRFKAGKAKSIDLEEMQANSLDEQASIYTNNASLAEKRASLTAIINQPATEVDRIRTRGLQQPNIMFSTEQAWLKRAKNHSPELLAAQQKVQVANDAIRKARGGYYPSVSGNVAYQDSDSADGELQTGLTLSVPLDTNGATRAQVDQAELEKLSAQQDVRQVELQIAQDVQQQFQQQHLYWLKVETAKQLVTQREKVAISQEALYNAGMASASDLINAHNDLFSARNQLKADLYSYWRARVNLWKAAGMLDKSTISVLAQALQHD
ncbi:TolC family protein [Vibrio profundum]|uniref:TolC family protein n=1 Tax=Vibrio profundum TaxID=2910247 RepID=UPI003D0E50C8